MNLLDELRRDFGFAKEVVRESIGNHVFGFRVPSSADVSAYTQMMVSRGRIDLENSQAALSVCSINGRPLYEVMNLNPIKFGYKHIENTDYPPMPLRHAAMNKFLDFVESDQVMPSFRHGLNAIYLAEIDAKHGLEIPYFIKRISYECAAEGCKKDKVRLSEREEGYFCHYCGTPLLRSDAAMSEFENGTGGEEGEGGEADDTDAPFSETPTSQPSDT